MRMHRLRFRWIYRCAGLVSALLVLGAVTATAAEAGTNPTPWGSIRQVSLMQFNGRLYMAWIDPHAHNELTIASTTDGKTWAPGTHPFGSGNSNSAPALVVFNGKLWMAWSGTDGNQTLNLASSSNGVNFGSATQPLGSNGSPDGPALAVFNGKLYYAWKGKDANQTLNISSSTTGTSFTAPVKFGSSINAPALAVWNGNLYMAWSGTDSSNFINLAWSADGVNFNNQFHFAFGSQFEPALALDPINNALDIEYKATGSQLLNVVYYTGVVEVTPFSIAGPIVQAPGVTAYSITNPPNTIMVHAWLDTTSGHVIQMCFMNAAPPYC